MSDFFIGRQPVYDRELQTYAYELSAIPDHEHGDHPAHQIDDSQFIINAFLEIGLDRLARNHYAVISLNEQLINNGIILSLPSNRMILKIPAGIKVDNHITQSIDALNKKGFIVSLDNYLQHPQLEALSSHARIINLDIKELDHRTITKHAKQLKKRPVILCASNVSTHEDYELCRDLEIDYFQGYFLSRPKMISGESLDANQLSIMKLLAILHNPETDTDTIDDIISKDISLSYKILKLINSAFFTLSTKIDSIHHAIVMLGRKQLCSWASIMALTSLDNKPSEQVQNAMIRAKSCELLAEKSGLDHSDSFFTVGMFSALDLLMDHELEELITPLPLADNITAALLQHQGEMGDALNCALAQETADWENIRFQSLTANELSGINIAAIQWTAEVLNSI
ncbi:MAG: HDOD domain-containing protein [Gammaproteobacteria bacterium]|nr:HDOD domain-containing protein [Gammaproteobacteria bacterium]